MLANGLTAAPAEPVLSAPTLVETAESGTAEMSSGHVAGASVGVGAPHSQMDSHCIYAALLQCSALWIG